MQSIQHLGLFITAGLVLNLTPGPDVLFIVASGLRGGVRSGVAAALGITAGCFVHIGAAALGVGALLAASASAFGLLKLVGALYLVWMGWGLLRAQAVDTGVPDGAPHPAQPLGAVFRQGFWTNALNPKVALFFLAFLPPFIAPDAPHQALSFVLLGLLFNFNGLWVNLGYALLAAVLARRLAGLSQAMRWVQRGAGLMFIGFGLKLAMADNLR